MLRAFQRLRNVRRIWAKDENEQEEGDGQPKLGKWGEVITNVVS